MTAIDEVAARIAALGPLDAAAVEAARAHLASLTKPPGSLGRLEELCELLAGITGDPRAQVSRRTIVVAAGDHGVAARGVSAYPSTVTAQMVANFAAGGAAVNQLAAVAGARVVVVDVGVAGEPAGAVSDAVSTGTGAEIRRARVRAGTADMTQAPAMTRAEAAQSVAIGIGIAEGLAADGVELVGLGEMGIGNTTAAAAIVAVMAGEPVAAVTGPGTGIDAAGRQRKVAAIEAALARHQPDPADPLGVLAAVGGLEIGALVGVALGATAARIPVVLDGFITGAAALVAAAIAPGARHRWIAAHQSPEPGHRVVLERLGLRPLLELDLRLGEGTGAALAFGLVDAAVRVRDGMATFASAGVDTADAVRNPGARGVS